MPLADIPRAFQQGVGDTLGFVALVIGLGTVIGKLLAESGGAVVVSQALVAALGERRLDWALLLSGFLIGLPVFFQVGLVLLAPVLFTVTRRPACRCCVSGIPLVAGLSAAHGLVPPHPGPLAAIERLGADTGRTLFYSLIVELPVALVVGSALRPPRQPARMHVNGRARLPISSPATRPRRASPSLGVTLLTILLPVAPDAARGAGAGDDGGRAGAAVDRVRRQPAGGDAAGDAAGDVHLRPRVRIRSRRGSCVRARSRCRRSPASCWSSAPGGGFGRVLVTAGVDKAIAQVIGGLQLSPLVLGWVIAALLRLSVGSATVRVVTAASIMAPMIGAMPHANRELLVVAIGAGSLIASHVNDGGFWLVKEYFNMSVPQTLATWTVLETVVSARRPGRRPAARPAGGLTRC